MLERHQDELATAALVFHELRYGCLRMPTSRKTELIEAFLERVLWGNLDILPYDALAAEWHAEERVRLSLKRRPPSFVDGQIAAIARVHGLILVTRNTADFAVFEGIKVQNWHAAACGTPEPDE